MLKSLGEDLVEILLNVIMLWETGVALFKKLEEFFAKILEVLKNPKALLEDVRAILSRDRKLLDESPLAKKTQYEKFKEKWKGKSILTLTKEEIVQAIIGYTEQGNRVAQLIEKNIIKINILEDSKFEQLLGKHGISSKDAKSFAAFCIDEANYFRSTSTLEQLLSEVIHEGTHALDSLSGFVGDVYLIEKRAFFHERAFQQAIGIEKDFETVAEMVEFIYINY